MRAKIKPPKGVKIKNSAHMGLAKSKGQRGFTLVEVLIAMVVLSVGIMALSLMMKQSVGSTDYGRKVTTAENLAVQKLESLKAKGYYNIPAPNAVPAGATYATVVEDYGAILGYPDYRREIDCRILQGQSVTAPQGFLKKVTVTVRWRSVGSIGQGGSVTLTTFVSPP